jgi:deazaflavin-dependent oxidoreductase (nitroreductase family)
MNTIPERKAFGQKIQMWAESTLLSRFALEHPHGLLKVFFKTPIFLWRIGLGGLVGPYYLLLSTRGRTSGKWRHTPLDFSRHKVTGEAVIMSGWGKASDWVKNINADPHVQAQIGRRIFAATAVPLSLDEAADVIEEYVAFTPSMKKIFEVRSGRSLDGSRENSLYTAGFFPGYRLMEENSP